MSEKARDKVMSHVRACRVLNVQMRCVFDALDCVNEALHSRAQSAEGLSVAFTSYEVQVMTRSPPVSRALGMRAIVPRSLST